MVRRGSARDQRGVTSLEFTLVMSMLIVVFLLMLQFALKVHAQRIATAAAEEGLADAASYTGSSAQGRATARAYLARLGTGLVDTQVAAGREADTAWVEVTGEAQPFLPFLPVHVEVRVQRRIEQFVEEGS